MFADLPAEIQQLVKDYMMASNFPAAKAIHDAWIDAHKNHSIVVAETHTTSTALDDSIPNSHSTCQTQPIGSTTPNASPQDADLHATQSYTTVGVAIDPNSNHSEEITE